MPSKLLYSWCVLLCTLDFLPRNDGKKTKAKKGFTFNWQKIQSHNEPIRLYHYCKKMDRWRWWPLLAFPDFMRSILFSMPLDFVVKNQLIGYISSWTSPYFPKILHSVSVSEYLSISLDIKKAATYVVMNANADCKGWVIICRLKACFCSAISTAIQQHYLMLITHIKRISLPLNLQQP